MHLSTAGAAVRAPRFQRRWPTLLVALPLAHPRHYSVKTTPEFAALKAELTEQVRVEVRAAQAAQLPA